MGLSWNSWYNPLDNVANIAGGLERTINDTVFGKAANSTSNPYTSPSGSAGIGVSNPTGYTHVAGAKSTDPAPSGNSPTVQPATDWMKNQSNTTNNTTPVYTGTYGTQANPYSQYDMDYLNDQINRVKGLYGNVDATWDNGQKGISDRYTNQKGVLDKQNNRAVEDYNRTEEKSEFGRGRELGKVDDSARSLADSLRQRIGLASGSGSSAYQINAPGAVAKDASGKRTGILEDYAQNFADLKEKRDRWGEDYKDSIAGLGRDKNSWLSKLEADTTSQRQSIDQQLIDLEAEKGRLRGGSYKDTRLNQQPYIDRYNSRDDTLNSLFAKYRSPTFSAAKVNAGKVNLRDYMTDNTRVVDNTQDSTYDPYTNYLKDDEEELV